MGIFAVGDKASRELRHARREIGVQVEHAEDRDLRKPFDAVQPLE
jgi:hypothetical protein